MSEKLNMNLMYRGIELGILNHSLDCWCTKMEIWSIGKVESNQWLHYFRLRSNTRRNKGNYMDF